MKILVLNPGSTSLKYSFFDTGKCTVRAKISVSDDFFADLMKKTSLKKIEDIDRFGIRIVHGGHLFRAPVRISKSILKKIETLSELAPLHNPPAITVIKSILAANSKADIIAVFDTAFHANMPKEATMYGIPHEFSEKFHIQKYGFHGIACASVLQQIYDKIGKKPRRLVLCHLGGGSSITAVKNGKSIETSMGFTPLEGLLMATRCGDLDVGILPYLSKKTGKDIFELEEILSKKSGLFGICENSDMQEILKSNNEKSELAVAVFLYRARKHLFASIGALGGIDDIAFSGGIGEGSAFLRAEIIKSLKIFGAKISTTKNKQYHGGIEKISTENSAVRIWIVEAREDEEIFAAAKKM